MGSGSSRLGSCPSPRNGAGTHQRRRPTVKRSLSSILVCGASSSQSANEVQAHVLWMKLNSNWPFHQFWGCVINYYRWVFFSCFLFSCFLYEFMISDPEFFLCEFLLFKLIYISLGDVCDSNCKVNFNLF